MIDSTIRAFFLTSKTKCIPGIADESCLLVIIRHDPSWPGINTIHEGARIVGDSMIDHVNPAFGVDVTFHSIYIHSELDAIPGIANPGTVTVAYTMPTRSSGSMYETNFTLSRRNPSMTVPHHVPNEKVCIIMESINMHLVPADLYRMHNINLASFDQKLNKK